MPRRILFVVKFRGQYGQHDVYAAPAYVAPYNSDSVYDGYGLPSGLANSARFVCEFFQRVGWTAALVHVVDGNAIEHEIVKFGPAMVVIEALWVTPEKLAELARRYPNVKFIVRVHSELPFLVNEGMAMQWLIEYCQYEHVYVAFNSARTYGDFLHVAEHRAQADHVLYLPNYYPIRKKTRSKKWKVRFGCSDVIRLGCFGALRPMKNQLTQAIAAIAFAKKHELCLEFHINATRFDDENALPVLKNIRALFARMDQTYFRLVEHPWLAHEDFMRLVGTMDMGLQMSLTESFNNVSADFTHAGVPVIVSPQIAWMPALYHADPTSVLSIVAAMERVMQHSTYFAWMNLPQRKLRKIVKKNAAQWLTVLRKL